MNAALKHRSTVTAGANDWNAALKRHSAVSAGAGVRVNARASHCQALIPKRLEDELCSERHLTVATTEDFWVQEV